jgi:hypothetical protein
MRAAVFNADNLLLVGVIVNQSSWLPRVWLFFVSVICSAVQAEWQSSFNSNSKFLERRWLMMNPICSVFDHPNGCTSCLKVGVVEATVYVCGLG